MFVSGTNVFGLKSGYFFLASPSPYLDKMAICFTANFQYILGQV